MKVEQMKHHAPGWRICFEQVEYRLWGPGVIHHDGIPQSRIRDSWAASITPMSRDDDDPREENAEWIATVDLEKCLSIFPAAVASAFRETVRA